MDHEDLLETLPEEVHLETPTRIRAPSEPGGRNRAALDPLPLMGGARVQSEPCTYTSPRHMPSGFSPSTLQGCGGGRREALASKSSTPSHPLVSNVLRRWGVSEIAMESYGPPRMIEEGERPGACPGNFSRVRHTCSRNASAHCVCGSGTLLCRSCAVAALHCAEVPHAIVQVSE